MPVLEKTRALIARPSVTPDDAGCLELIAGWLIPLGFTCERLDAGGVANLWATRRGTGEGRVICFAGHTDVVPPGSRDAWASDPFTPTERDGKLYGRGAADMKSSIAAAITAVERLLARRAASASALRPCGKLSDTLAFLLTSDEEGDAIHGTAHVVEVLKSRGERIDFCIVGEPTCVERLGDTVKNGRRGSLSGHLLMQGVQGHVAYPQLARNPVHQAAPALAELVATTWDEGNADFPPTTLQISGIHAGTGASNVIPGSLAVDFNFRFATASTAEGLQARVHQLLDRHGIEYALRWTLGAKPFLTPRGDLCAALTDAIFEASGVSPTLSTTGGTSDGRFLVELCAQVAEFGPVNASIHKIDEHIALADLEPLARIYEGAFARLAS